MPFACLYLRLLLCHQLLPCSPRINWLRSTEGSHQIKGMTFELASFKCIFFRLMKCNIVRWGVFFIFDPKIVFIWFLNCYFFCLSSIAIRNIFRDILLLLKIFLGKCSSNILRLRLHPRLQVSQCQPVVWQNTVTSKGKRLAIIIRLKMMTTRGKY